MNIVIFGATGGTGRPLMEQALAAGHRVTVLVRTPGAIAAIAARHDERLRVVQGDVRRADEVAAVVAGQDAVLSALGPRGRGPTTLCTEAMANILAAMERHGVRRLVALSAYGARESHACTLYNLLLWGVQREKMRDKGLMEELLVRSAVDWTVVRPPALSDGPRTGAYRTGVEVPVDVTSRIARADVANFMLRAAAGRAYLRAAPTIVAARGQDVRQMAGTETTDGMRGQVVLVTGAAGDMGRAIAAGLARQGAGLALVVRRREQGEALRRDLVRATGNAEVEILVADLSSQREIRRLADAVRGRFARLHVLVNNAGVHLRERRLSPDGIEMHLAVNHLAPFLLTNLLLDVLEAGAPARVVNVASQSMADTRLIPLWGRPRPATLEPDNLQGERRFEPMDAYARSKLAMVMCGYVLDRRLAGRGVTVNALHPGLVATSIAADVAPPPVKPFLGLVRPFLLSPEAGARTAIYLASSPEVAGVTGKYFIKQAEARSPAISYDTRLQEELWQASAALVGLA